MYPRIYSSSSAKGKIMGSFEHTCGPGIFTTSPSEHDVKLCELSLELDELLELIEKQKQPPEDSNEFCIFDFSSAVVDVDM
jgi:hypothetical protein